MVSVGNYRGVVSSRDKTFYVGPSTHTRGYGKFVIARYACYTNSNTKLRLCLRLHLDFLPSLFSGKKLAIHPCAGMLRWGCTGCTCTPSFLEVLRRNIPCTCIWSDLYSIVHPQILALRNIPGIYLLESKKFQNPHPFGIGLRCTIE